MRDGIRLIKRVLRGSQGGVYYDGSKESHVLSYRDFWAVFCIDMIIFGFFVFSNLYYLTLILTKSNESRSVGPILSKNVQADSSEVKEKKFGIEESQFSEIFDFSSAKIDEKPDLFQEVFKEIMEQKVGNKDEKAVQGPDTNQKAVILKMDCDSIYSIKKRGNGIDPILMTIVWFYTGLAGLGLNFIHLMIEKFNSKQPTNYIGLIVSLVFIQVYLIIWSFVFYLKRNAMKYILINHRIYFSEKIVHEGCSPDDKEKLKAQKSKVPVLRKDQGKDSDVNNVKSSDHEHQLKKHGFMREREPLDYRSIYEGDGYLSEDGCCKMSEVRKLVPEDWLNHLVARKPSENVIEEERCHICGVNTPSCIFMDCTHGGICFDCAREHILSNKTCFYCKQVYQL